MSTSTGTFLRRNGGKLVACVPVLILTVLAVVGPWITPYSATKVVDTPQLPPSAEHWFGTDSTGFDVYSRVIAAVQVDFTLGLIAVAVSTAFGAAFGLLIGMNESRAGVVGGIARTASRALDLLQAIPAVVIAMVIISFFGTTLASLVVALAIVLAPNQARLVRAETLRVRNEAYLDAARMSGVPEYAVLVRHVLPNASWPALENATVIFGSAVFLVAALGFLGVGLHPPTPEWGSMIAIGASDAAVGRWWAFVFPALATMMTVTCVAWFGHALFGAKVRRRRRQRPAKLRSARSIAPAPALQEVAP
jgi:peptide/nickel transport system permease protein